MPFFKDPKIEEIIQCSACELTFNATCNYIQHYKYIHGGGAIIGAGTIPSQKNTKSLHICEKCGKGFSKKQKILFDEHVSQNLCHQQPVSATLSNQQSMIQCEICSETFTGQQYYVQHYR